MFHYVLLKLDYCFQSNTSDFYVQSRNDIYICSLQGEQQDFPLTRPSLLVYQHAARLTETEDRAAATTFFNEFRDVTHESTSLETAMQSAILNAFD